MAQYPVRSGPIDVAVVPVLEGEGCHNALPDKPRLFTSPRLPIPFINIPVAAPIQLEDCRNVYPDKPRLFRSPRLPFSFIDVQVAAPIRLEAEHNVYPDTPRLFTSPRLPFAHVDNPTASVMAEANHNVYPDRGRLPQIPRLPFPSQDSALGVITPVPAWDASQRGFNSWRPNLTKGSQTPVLLPIEGVLIGDIAHVDVPMRPRIPERIHTMRSCFIVIAVKDVMLSPPLLPVRPNLTRATPIPQPIVIQPDPPPNSPDMSQGSHPDRNRQLLAEKIPLPIVTQPDPPVFSPEMAEGSIPPCNRQLLGGRIPLPIAEVHTVVSAFSPDMAAGWQPQHRNIRLGERIPLPFVHLTTEFDNSYAGYHPDKARLFKPRRTEQSVLPDTTGMQLQEFLTAHPDTPRLSFHQHSYDTSPAIQWDDIQPPPRPEPVPVCIPFRADVGPGANPRPTVAGVPVSRSPVKPKDCKDE